MSRRSATATPVAISTPLRFTPVANAAETGLISQNTPVVVNTPSSRLNGIPPGVVTTPRYSPLTSNSPRTTPRVMNAEVLPPITPPVGSSTVIPTPQNSAVPYTPLNTGSPATIIEENPVSNEPFEFYGAGEKIADPAVETELISYGYLPTQKIMINENNEKQAMFIKATNKFGQPILIKLDDEGKVVESTSDLTIIKTNTGQIGDYSSRVGEKICMQTEACGLAYVCNNGICVMENDNNGRVVESKFEFVKRFSEQDAIIGDEPVAYPVVTLSDIRANSALVLEITNRATKRLRNAAYANSTVSLVEVRENIQRLNEAFNIFLNVRSMQEKRLMNSIAVLESYILRYEALCNKVESQAELQKHKDVIANLTLRNDKVMDLLRAVKNVTNINIPLMEIVNTITESTRFLQEEFVEIDTAYTL
jgi:hypothetical protein